MGFFDFRCLASGLSLCGERAVAIWLLRDGEKFVPISLPVRGAYDRLGSVDGVKTDSNTARLLDAFESALAAKRLKLKGDAAWTWKNDSHVHGMERVLRVIERSTSQGEASLSGKELALTLVHERIYDAVVAATRAPLDVNTTDLIALAFPHAEGRRIYASVAEAPQTEREAMRRDLEGFIAFSRWLTARGEWNTAPTFHGVGEQHGDVETLRAFREARARFADLPWMLDAIEACAMQSGEHSDDFHSGWLRGPDTSWYGLVADGEYVATATLDGLRALLAELVPHAPLGQLIHQPFGVFTVQRGIAGPPLALLPFLSVELDARLVPAAEAEEADAQLATPAKKVLAWERLSAALAPLEAPLATGDEVFAVLPQPQEWEVVSFELR